MRMLLTIFDVAAAVIGWYLAVDVNNNNWFEMGLILLDIHLSRVTLYPTTTASHYADGCRCPLMLARTVLMCPITMTHN